MKYSLQKPLTTAATSLVLAISAGTLVADEAEDFLGNEEATVATAEYSSNHFAIRGFYGFAVEDDLYEGDGAALDVFGITLEYTHSFKKPQDTFGAELLLRFDYGYGNDEYDYGSYGNDEWTMNMWNLSTGVNFVAENESARFFFGPRIGVSVVSLEEEYEEAHYSTSISGPVSGSTWYTSGSEDETNVGLLYGIQAGIDLRFTANDVLSFEFGYFATTAMPDDFEDQSFLTVGVGYKHSF